jgi:hypothetical protein
LEDGTVSAIDAMMTKFPSDGFYILQGEVAVNRRVDTKSYTSLHALVHGMFPPMTSFEQVSSVSLFYSMIIIIMELLCIPS